jgi:hypothetical protein
MMLTSLKKSNDISTWLSGEGNRERKTTSCTNPFATAAKISTAALIDDKLALSNK